MILEPHVKYVQSLPLEIIDSLLDYTGEKYNEINLYLHHGEDEYDNYISSGYSFDKIKNAIHNIDTAFENAPPLEEPLILFRGIRSYSDKYYESKGYMSTSLNIIPAEAFIGLSKCCILVITVPVGSKIIAIRSMKKQIKNAKTNQEEDEILLDRDSTLMVVGYGKDEISKINLIYCVYVPKQAIPMDILTEEEKEYCKKAVELLGSGNYSVQLINEYNGKTYTLILEHHQTGEELKFDFTYSLPIQGIPSLGGSKEAVGEKISQQNEFVKNLLESFIK
jgi:hypothetical protein